MRREGRGSSYSLAFKGESCDSIFAKMGGGFAPLYPCFRRPCNMKGEGKKEEAGRWYNSVAALWFVVLNCGAVDGWLVGILWS